MRGAPGARRLAMVLACVALVAGCEAPPKPAPVPPTDAPAPRDGEPATPVAPASRDGSAPAPTPVPRAEEIKGILDAARLHLDQGQEEAALAEIQRVLVADPQHKAALSFLRQIREDPMNVYGRESWPYKVVAGEGLAIIAQRFLNDRDQFYGLARYNGIKVPRQLAVGQTIRIPGKQPARMPPREPAQAREPAPPREPVPPREPAPQPAPPPTPALAPAPPAAPAPDPAAEQAKAERARKDQVEALKRRARAAMARQDVCGAIALWREVLVIEPGDRTAALELERALETKKRLPSAKC